MYALLLAVLVVGVVVIVLLMASGKMFGGPHIEDSQFYGDVEITKGVDDS